MPSVDAIVIGAGHNGLVCAAYLAKAGLGVVVLERSHRIGGACVTEELIPGFRFSTFAYGAHGPGPKICRDLEIPAGAFGIIEFDPVMFAPFDDGDSIVIWRDPQRTAAALEQQFGTQEAAGYLAYLRFMDDAITMAQEWLFSPPMTHQELSARYAGTPRADVLRSLLTRSHWDVLGDFFKHEKTRCAMARSDDCGSPTVVGSLLSEVVESASTGAGVENKAGIPAGGMGTITRVLADTARRFGVEVRTNAAVERVMVENGRAVGVRLASGEEIRAQVVISNADPKRTFLSLVDENDLATDFVTAVRRIKTRARYMKLHAALRGTPRFVAAPDAEPRMIAAARIAPSLKYVEDAWRDAERGKPSRRPVMSLQLPTAYEPGLAPAGKHVFGAWVRYAPATEHSLTSDELRAASMRNILDVIETYAPGFADLIDWHRLYTAEDIERETGMTDGSIRHIDMTLDQMLHLRPMHQWSAYQSPIEGLFLCGSGTHPCGSVTGAPGHNAAHAVLENLKRTPLSV